MNRYKSYVIPGETLIPGGRGKRLGKVLDMPHISIWDINLISVCLSVPSVLLRNRLKIVDFPTFGQFGIGVQCL